jgi:hypothetical protein
VLAKLEQELLPQTLPAHYSLSSALTLHLVNSNIGKRGSYITAESSIENDVLVSKERIDVARTPSIESHNRQSPISSHGSAVRDIRRDAAAREEPDVDAGAFPLHGVHPSSVAVEGVTVSIRGGGCDSATGVGVVRVAVGVQEGGSGLRTCSVDSAS